MSPTKDPEEATGEDKAATHPVYVDHAGTDNKFGMEEELLPSRLTNANFPMKLHYMLSDMKRDGNENIVSWMPHGRAFRVNNQHLFVERVLPLYFQIQKYPSFQRQLNIYNFRRLTRGQDKGCYYHELFLRGKRFLAKNIPRWKVKKSGPRKPADPDSEPNFYVMPYLPEEHATAAATDPARKGLPTGPIPWATMMNPAAMQYQWMQQYGSQMMAQMQAIQAQQATAAAEKDKEEGDEKPKEGENEISSAV